MQGAPGQVLRESLRSTAFDLTAVSMGNPHCVVFVDDPQTFDVAYWAQI